MDKNNPTIKHIGIILILAGALVSLVAESLLAMPVIHDFLLSRLAFEILAKISEGAIIAGVIHIFIEFEFVKKTIFEGIKNILTQREWISTLKDQEKTGMLQRVISSVYSKEKIKSSGLSDAVQEIVAANIPYYIKDAIYKMEYSKVAHNPNILRVTRTVDFNYIFTDYCQPNQRVKTGLGLQLLHHKDFPKAKEGPLTEAQIKIGDEDWKDNLSKPTYNKDGVQVALYDLSTEFIRKKADSVIVKIKQIYYIPIEDTVIRYNVGKTPINSMQLIVSGDLFGEKGGYDLLPNHMNCCETTFEKNHNGKILTININGWLFKGHGIVIVRKPRT